MIKRIIVSVVLIFGIVMWRTATMQQAETHPVQVTFATSDGQSVSVPLERARLFGTIQDMLEYTRTDESTIPLTHISSTVLQRLLLDLAWVLQMRADVQAGETVEECIRRNMQGMPAPAYTQQSFLQRVDDLEAAQFLGSPELIQRYKRDVTRMVMSDAGLQDVKNGAIRAQVRDVIRRLVAHVSEDAAERFTNDLAWVLQVREAPGAAAEMYDQRIRRIVSALPTVQYRFSALQMSGERHRIAEFMESPELIARYTKELAELLMSAEGLHALGRNDAYYMNGLRGLSPATKNDIFNRYMVRFVVIQESTIQHAAQINAVAFSPGGGLIGTASGDRMAKIIIRDGVGWREMRTIETEVGGFRAVDFSPEGNKALFASSGGYVYIEGENSPGVWRTQYRINHTNAHKAVFSPAIGNALEVLTQTRDAVDISAFRNNIWNREYHFANDYINNPNGAIHEAAFAPNGNRMAFTCQNNFRICSFNGGAWQEEYAGNRGGGVGAPLFSPDSNRILMPLFGGVVILARQQNGTWIEEYTNQHAMIGQFSPDGNEVLIVGREIQPTIVRLNGNAWDLVQTIQGIGASLHAEFSSDGVRILIVSGNNVHIIRKEGQAWVREFTIPYAGNTVACFSPDGRRIATLVDGITRIIKFSNNAWIEEGVFPDVVLSSRLNPSPAVFSPVNSGRFITIHQDRAIVRLLLEGANFDQALLIQLLLEARRDRPGRGNANNWVTEVLQTYEEPDRGELRIMLDTLMPGIIQAVVVPVPAGAAHPRPEAEAPPAQRRRIDENNNHNNNDDDDDGQEGNDDNDDDGWELTFD